MGWKPVAGFSRNGFPLAKGEIVSGVPELQQLFKELKRGLANKVARPAINKAASIAAKRVKASIPARFKDARKAIGWRSIKTKHNGGIVGAKIGGAVRKQQSDGDIEKKRQKPGVGISARNVHWWFFGTDRRTTGWKKRRIRGPGGQKTYRLVETGNKVKNTGAMNPQIDPIDSLVQKHKGELVNVMRMKLQESLQREVQKHKS